MAFEFLNQHDLDSSGLGKKAAFGTPPRDAPEGEGRFISFLRSGDDDTLVFKGQRGPIKEVGVNGAQIDDLVRVCLATLRSLNAQFRCVENEEAVGFLNDALAALHKRTLRRKQAGIEGTNEEKK